MMYIRSLSINKSNFPTINIKRIESNRDSNQMIKLDSFDELNISFVSKDVENSYENKARNNSKNLKKKVALNINKSVLTFENKKILNTRSSIKTAHIFNPKQISNNYVKKFPLVDECLESTPFVNLSINSKLKSHQEEVNACPKKKAKYRLLTKNNSKNSFNQVTEHNSMKSNSNISSALDSGTNFCKLVNRKKINNQANFNAKKKKINEYKEVNHKDILIGLFKKYSFKSNEFSAIKYYFNDKFSFRKFIVIYKSITKIKEALDLCSDNYENEAYKMSCSLIKSFLPIEIFSKIPKEEIIRFSKIVRGGSSPFDLLNNKIIQVLIGMFSKSNQLNKRLSSKLNSSNFYDTEKSERHIQNYYDFSKSLKEKRYNKSILI